MGSLARQQRWCALLLCAQLTACAAPGEPTVINSLALAHPPGTSSARPGPAPSHVATRPLPHASAVALAAPVVRTALRKRDDAVARPAVRPTLGATTIEQAPAATAAESSPATAAPLVPTPPLNPTGFSPLSPEADPTALVPAGSTAVASTKTSARDATLAPGPSLCSLGRDSTADDVILNTQPCPVDLRPTLKPVEPTQ